MLYVKNMVCGRCIMVVKNKLEELRLSPLSVILGEVELKNTISDKQMSTLETHLKQLGFELIGNKIARIIEKIKTTIIVLVHHRNNDLQIKLSDYLSKKLMQDYSTLSNLFSEVEGMTIEKYYILQKVEKVKELLMYNEMTLSEISYQLNYSSVGYLSNQFKKITGFTPSHYKVIKENKRKRIEDV